jgi:predicted 3-demethylubiquinone-9 3-methyltransferase (glyoxalase superfamily)
MQKITTFLMFNNQAEDALNFYISIFNNSKIVSTIRPGGDNSALMGATIQLEGQEFILVNGGPQFAFSQAISLFVKCETQAEIDELWAKLSEGGEKLQCGWLKDKFGVSWQIIPPILGELLAGKDSAKAKRVMDAMLQMTKINIKALKQAAG